MAAACTAAEQPDVARSVYTRAIEALPDALLLTFAYADFEATQGKSAAATEAFEALLVRFPRPFLLSSWSDLSSCGWASRLSMAVVMAMSLSI